MTFSLFRNLAATSALTGFTILFTLPTVAQWKQSTGGGAGITALAANGNTVVQTATDSIYRSTDNGQTWELENGNLPIFVGDLTIAGSDIVAANNGTGGTILSSIDNGATWNNDTMGYGDPFFYAAFALTLSGSTIYAGTVAGVYKQSPGSEMWAPDTLGTSVTPYPEHPGPWTVGAFATSGNDLYMEATYSGTYSQIFYSTNGGAPWVEIGHTSNQLDSSSIDFLQTSPSSLYAIAVNTDSVVSGLNLFRTTNNGGSWTQQNSSYLLFGHVQGFVSKGETLFVACDSGVMVSNDFGVTWKGHNENLPPPIINILRGSTNFLTGIAISGPNLVVGTYEDGVWYRPLSDFGAASVPSNQNGSGSLSLSISENPVQSSSVDILYSIPENGISKITLTDALGREIHVLQNDWSPAGRNTIPLDVQAMPLGIYFVRLEANGSSAMQKLAISK